MIQAFAYVLFYGIIAAASPLALAATFVVIRSDRKRTNGIALLGGFLLGTIIACILGLLLGQAFADNLNSRETIDGLLALFIGIALVVIALGGRSVPLRPETATGRGTAILAGLEHVGPAAALSMAGLLGFGGPKRLILTLLAMATVSDDAVGAVGDVALVALYVAVATLVVSVPIALIVTTGDWGVVTLQRSETWLRVHNSMLRVRLGLGVGVLLIVSGVARLAM